ncbi:bifunctional metallophosphatase/5'-nucleotidase [Pseudogracilibacillus sp. ICA-222130]|uniref:bifunctional metallophosphatase/5'-nucleotidase n=1 Tax=Pseudogracilibacillus sp. ICA-222130 TaxID=3134655 RepID=UPI0030BCCBCD
MSKIYRNLMTKFMLVLMIIFTTIPATGLAEPAIHNDQSENSSSEEQEQNVEESEEVHTEDDEEEEQEDTRVKEEEKENGNDSSDSEVPMESVETTSDEESEDETNEEDVQDSAEDKEVPAEDEIEENEDEIEENENDEDENFQLKVMHLNDTHSHADKLPKAITEIKEQRKNSDNNLLLHAGDSFSGTLYFNLHKGKADLAMFNLMGLDAFTFGNHEFDLGTSEGHPELQTFIENASFPFLGTNVDFSDDPTLAHVKVQDSVVREANGGKAYNAIIKEIDGEEIGIFGLTTEDTKNVASPELVTFLNYKESAERAVDALEEEGVNKIIAVTHIGYDSNPAVGNDLVLAEQVDGIDIIVGGHSHTELDNTVVKGTEEDPTLIVQTGQYVDNLGVLDVVFDEEGKIIEHEGKLVDLTDVQDDPEAVDVLATYKAEVDALFNEPSGAEALKELTNPRHTSDDKSDSVRANETELGNLVTDAMLAKAKEKFPETEIALQNGGGIRAPIAKGEITNGEIIEVLPFGNDPVVATITGAELKEILEHSVSQAPNENGGFLHVAGMKYYFDSKKEVGDRVIDMQVLKNGEYMPIDLQQTYTVTTNQFTAQGGDGFETFAKVYEEGRVTNIGEVDWEQLRDYMVEEEYLNGKVNPEREGRILDAALDEIPEDPTDPDPTPTPDPDPTPDPNPDPAPTPDPDPTPDPNPDPAPTPDSDPTPDTKPDPAPTPDPVPNEPGDGNENNTEEDKGTVITPGKDDDDQAKRSALPNTATTMYTTLLIGSLLLLVGIAIYAIRKFRMN